MWLVAAFRTPVGLVEPRYSWRGNFLPVNIKTEAAVVTQRLLFYIINKILLIFFHAQFFGIAGILLYRNGAK